MPTCTANRCQSVGSRGSDKEDFVKLQKMLIGLLLLIVLVGCAGAPTEKPEKIMSASYAGGAVKVILLTSVSSAQKASCVHLAAGKVSQQVTVVTDTRLLYEKWELDNISYQEFSTSSIGACYSYQHQYYLVAA
jgi:hypothetical protein